MNLGEFSDSSRRILSHSGILTRPGARPRKGESYPLASFAPDAGYAFELVPHHVTIDYQSH